MYFTSKYKANKFLTSLSMLISGSVIAQILTLLVSPITTRLFSPAEFGFYTLITTAVALFGPIICLKYDMAIIVSKTEKEIYSLVKLCLLLCVPLSIVISIIYGYFFIRSEYTGFSFWINIIFLSILLIAYGLNNVLLAHNNKNGFYKLISSVTVIKSLVNNVLLIISGLFHFGVLGLIGSQIVSTLSGLRRQSEDIRKNIAKIKEIDISVLKNTFYLHRDQPIYNATSALINTSIYSSINLFIKAVYTTEQLGLYSLSYRVLGVPFSVISANVSRVYFESAVKEVSEYGNYNKTFRKTAIILIIIVIPLISLLAIISPWLFSLVFGTEWEDAGHYVRLLAPMFAVRLIVESLTTSFIVSKKQHIELLFQAILFGGELIIYLVSHIQGITIDNFLVLISLLYVIIYITIFIVMNKLSKLNLLGK